MDGCRHQRVGVPAPLQSTSTSHLHGVVEGNEAPDNDSLGENNSLGSSMASQTTGSRGCDASKQSSESQWEDDWDSGPEDFEQESHRHGRRPRDVGHNRLQRQQRTSVLSQGRRRLRLTSVYIKNKTEEWIRSGQAELLFGGLIAVNAVIIGLEVEAELRFGQDSKEANMLYWLQVAFAGVFVAELLLRIRAHGLRHMLCSSEGRCEGIFDFVVVLLTVVDVWVLNLIAHLGLGTIWGSGRKSLEALGTLRILHLVRLLRIIRILRVSRQLSLLVVGFAQSIGSVLWVFLMLFVVIFISSSFCTLELGAAEDENLQKAFGNIWLSMYSHFKIMTLEAWPDICGWAMEQNNAWAFYFIGYILVTHLVLVNLVTGLVMDGVLQGAKSEDWSNELKVVEAESFVEAVKSSIPRILQDDATAMNGLDQTDFTNLLTAKDPLLHDLLELFSICLNHVEPGELFNLLDVQGNGVITVKELAAGWLQMRGASSQSRNMVHPLLVRNDLNKEGLELQMWLKACELHLSEQYDTEVACLEQTLRSKVQEMLKEVVQAARCAVMTPPLRTPSFHEGLAAGTPPPEEVVPQSCWEVRTAECLELVGSKSLAEPAEQDEGNPFHLNDLSTMLRRATVVLNGLATEIRDAEAALAASVAREAALESALRLCQASRITQTEDFPVKPLFKVPVIARLPEPPCMWTETDGFAAS